MRKRLVIFSLILALSLLLCSVKLIGASGGQKDNNILHDGDAVQNAHWSPNGKQVTYLDENSHLWIMDLKTRRSNEIVSDPNTLVEQSAWVTPSKLIVEKSEIEPNQKYTPVNCEITLLDLATGKQVNLLKDIPFTATISVYRNTVYLGQDLEGVVKFNIENPHNLTQVKIPMKEGVDFKLSPQGDKIAFLDSGNEYSNKSDHLYIYDISTKITKPITVLKYAKISQFTWAHDGELVSFIGKLPTDPYNRAYIASLNQFQEPKQILSDNIGNIEWSPIADVLLVQTVGQPGQNELRLLSIPNGEN